MPEVTVEQRFHGAVALAVLHLRRVAHSNDLDVGFAAAHELHMIGHEHETFIRRCLEIDQALENGGATEPVTLELVKELQACVLRLNSADPA